MLCVAAGTEKCEIGDKGRRESEEIGRNPKGKSRKIKEQNRGQRVTAAKSRERRKCLQEGE